MIEFNVFERPFTVQVDWDYALLAIDGLDAEAAHEGRLPIGDKAAIRILAEYGAIAYRCASVPSNTRLAIVVGSPRVWFCPSKNGLDGVFIEEYDSEKHGNGIFFRKETNLLSYSNIDARLDGWSFYSQMLSFSLENGSQNKTLLAHKRVESLETD